MLAKLVCRWGTPVGSFTVWNMVFSRMDKCRLTKLLEEVMTLSTHFLLKLEPGSTYQGL